MLSTRIYNYYYEIFCGPRKYINHEYGMMVNTISSQQDEINRLNYIIATIILSDKEQYKEIANGKIVKWANNYLKS